MTTSRKALLRRRLGVGMMAASLGLGISVSVFAPAGAQESDEPEMVELEVLKQAYFTTTAGRGAPNTVTSEFPPGVVCIVQPQLCPEELNPVREPVGGALGSLEEGPEEPNTPLGPAAAVQPGTLPVGVQAGETRYTSALQVAVPAVPAGEEFGGFVLRLNQDDTQSFHTSSPMFRQAILAALASYQQGGFAQDEFEKALGEEPVSGQILGMEACPIVGEEFAAGENQAEEATPEVDCILGANGTFDDEANTWSFDLTFAAEAWSDGSLPNLGILLRPASAPNLAYGDKDFTSSSRVVLTTAVVTGAVETQPEREAPAPFTPAPSNNNSTPTQNFSSGTGGIAPSTIVQPDVAPEVADEPVQEQPQTENVAVPFLPEEPGSAWWIWLLVPVFLAGMYLTAQSLTSEAVLAGAGREGAMSRLIAQTGPAATPAAGPREGAMSRLTANR